MAAMLLLLIVASACAVSLNFLKDSGCFQPAMYVPGYEPLKDATVMKAMNTFESSLGAATSGMFGSLSVGLVYDQDVFWSKGFGLLNMSDPSRGAPNADTPYRIGSITKVFTSLMMLQLRDVGEVNIDEVLTDLLPEFDIKNPFGGPGARLGLLASHMAGLPREMPCQSMFESGCAESPHVLLSRLANMSMILPAGLRPSYSNLGFALLGRALETRTEERSWEKFVQHKIVHRMGMQNSGNNLSSAVGKMAVGYNSANNTATLVELGYASPAGQMFSSVNDLAKLMALVFTDEVRNGTDSEVLQAQTVREWMHPVFTNPDGTGFGQPWELVAVGNYTLYTKSGDINGYSAIFVTVPPMKLGFVALQSCEDPTAIQGAVNAFLSVMLPAFDTALRAVAQAPAQPPQPLAYTGTFHYMTTDFGPTALTVSQATIRGWPVLTLAGVPAALAGSNVLEYRGNDTFMMTTWGIPDVSCSTAEAGQQQLVMFSRDGSGAVVSFAIPGRCWNCTFTKSQ